MIAICGQIEQWTKAPIIKSAYNDKINPEAITITRAEHDDLDALKGHVEKLRI
eukprot:Pgem_evm2s16158